MRILVVEDDPLLAEGIATGLSQAGFQVDRVADGLAALHAAEGESFSALVLDIGLPKLDGLAVLQALRKAGNPVPVLILTARDTPQDAVAGLDAGGDDYLVKPFDLGELAARLRALIRRAAGSAAAQLEHRGVQLDPSSREVRWLGQAVTLSGREFDLLHELLLAAGKVRTRAQLEARLYPWGEELESNALEVHVHHLRRKLAAELIRTVRGVGYLIPK